MLRDPKEEELLTFVQAYNHSWLAGDIDLIRPYYPENDCELIYFDNHPNNDTHSVSAHLALVQGFFQHGKSTESGTVEEILMENVRMFHTESTACICSLLRYKSFPKPAVRSTLYLERELGEWKIKHVHCSFEPCA